MKRRKASIIDERSGTESASEFCCAICDRSNQGITYVRLLDRRLCWPCARAIYRRLVREVANGTKLGLRLQRVGRQTTRVPAPALDIEEDQIAEGRARAAWEMK